MMLQRLARRFESGQAGRVESTCRPDLVREGESQLDPQPSFTYSQPRSPDAHTILLTQIKFLSRFDLEGLVPGIYIAHGICPVLGRRVRVGEHLLAQRGLAYLRLTTLAIGHKELLVSGEPVLCVGGAVAEPRMIAVA